MSGLFLSQVRSCSQPVRCLNLQEYQSKKLMADNGIAVQPFRVAQSLADAEDISKEFSTYLTIIQLATYVSCMYRGC